MVGGSDKSVFVELINSDFPGNRSYCEVINIRGKY